MPEPVRDGKSISELGLENEILVVKLAAARAQEEKLEDDLHRLFMENAELKRRLLEQ